MYSQIRLRSDFQPDECGCPDNVNQSPADYTSLSQINFFAQGSTAKGVVDLSGEDPARKREKLRRAQGAEAEPGTR